ncbi:hypothetical protein EVJ58_g2991 [Rhodofomes roseus]|uniref:Uncharacterized protein n=1 Tax=Rhodofomes roseus TaxID=34475 RepID=A0A4Y9YMY3_9APHY|nr:hypothetical protein EVJ58_g2991 [Rhodofomes roseus]
MHRILVEGLYSPGKQAPLNILMTLEAPAGGAKQTFASFLSRLRVLLDPLNLPPQLPLCCGVDSKYSAFLNFSLDQDLLEMTESEIGTVNEQFKGIFGWQTRSTSNSIIWLEERGEPLLLVVDVLAHYHGKHPTDAVLMKWGYNIGTAAEHAYKQHGVLLPSTSDVPAALTACESQKRACAPSNPVPEPLPVVTESDHSDVGSSDALASKGHPPKELMNHTIEKHRYIEDKRRGKSVFYWTCISPDCNHKANGHPVEVCIFRHAVGCVALGKTHPDVKHAIIDAQSQNALGAQLAATSAADRDTASADGSRAGNGRSSSPTSTASAQPPHKKPKPTKGTLT